MAPDPFPYQRDGAAWLTGDPHRGIGDEPGLGKTYQAILAADKLGMQRGIVVAPAAVRQVWQGEFRKFATLRRKVLKGRDIQDLNLWLRGRADVLLLSYEMATKWAPKIKGDLFDFLVCDEAHYAKNGDSARTRALLGTKCDGDGGLMMWASHTWPLSGTFMANDPVDLWTWLRALGGTKLTLTAFTARYFHSRMGTFGSRQTPRENMVAELQLAIRSVILRRTKKEVGLQLPPIWPTTVTVDGDTAEIRDLLRSHPGMEQAVLDAIEQGGLSFLDAQHVATLRRLVGEAKAPAFVEMIGEELESGGLDKVVIMGVHKQALLTVAQGLHDKGFKVVVVNGDTPEAQRVGAVEAFQTDPQCRVFIGNVRAAGTGLTLTAAANVVMFESSWAPADNAQALMRVHRIGQQRQVHARFISLANSIDEVVSETLARKTRAILQIEGEEAA